jgi:hypothetical protein
MDPHLKVKVQQFEISSQHFGSFMHTLGFFTLFCTFLSVYLILYKSTTHMRVYKWYLLNIAICCGLFDAYLSLIYTPNVLLPVFGVCLDGLWSDYMKERAFSIACFVSYFWGFGRNLFWLWQLFWIWEINIEQGVKLWIKECHIRLVSMASKSCRSWYIETPKFLFNHACEL